MSRKTVLFFSLLAVFMIHRSAFAKGDTVKITLTNLESNTAIDVTDDSVKRFNVWRPAVFIGRVPQDEGFIIKWSKGVVPAPQTVLPLAAEHADIYAIYSKMMTNPSTSHGPDNNPIYLIDEMTQPGYPVVPCVRVPPEFEAAYAEILDEYNRRKDQHVKLERAFSIEKPYALLNPAQVGKFIDMNTIRRIPDPNSDARFRIATDLFRLGDVYFNKRRSLALTYISTFCGSACGLGNWKVFQKTPGGTWEERPWVTCGGIA